MTNITALVLSLLALTKPLIVEDKFICRQGQVSFFSYTKVENIKAINTTVYSILNLENKEIAVSMLMKAFTFEKSLMQSHFNESYIESDTYPKAFFTGKLENYKPSFQGIQTVTISGDFTLHGVTKKVEFKAQVNREKNDIKITGEGVLAVDDFNINIPPILRPNISKTIKLTFNLKHSRYEK